MEPYLHPRERAVVLCVDENSQTQALDRTWPRLPACPDVADRQMHDCTWNGTTSLFAALKAATDEVIRRCFRRVRSVEFKQCLAIIDNAVPPKLDIHLVLDNYGTNNTAMIHKWLIRGLPAPPGSINSSGGSPRSLGGGFDAGAFAATQHSRR